MKKIIVLLLAFSLYSCNDGDFDVPAFEFTDTINTCGEYTIYKSNSESTEVIVLTLSSSSLSTTPGDKTLEISTSNAVTYRIFSDGISSNYFCQDIPPSTPKVVKELIAESGTFNINTIEDLTDGEVTGYTYTITISDLLLSNEDDKIIFDNFDFGEFTINL